MVMNKSKVVFQLGFGLKQSRPSCRSPVVRLLQAPDEALCPVRHIQAYIAYTAPLHSARSFFITTIPPHGAAAHITLCQWFSKVLQLAEITAPPGSSRAAVASTTLTWGVSENAVM